MNSIYRIRPMLFAFSCDSYHDHDHDAVRNFFGLYKTSRPPSSFEVSNTAFIVRTAK